MSKKTPFGQYPSYFSRKILQWTRLLTRLLLDSKENRKKHFHATSLDIADNEVLTQILGVRPHFYNKLLPVRPKTYIGWGQKLSGQKARYLAKKHNRNFILVEDGFIRSIVRNDSEISLILDHSGIYYDARTPSDLEKHIKTTLTEQQKERTKRLITSYKEHRISKINCAPEYTGSLEKDYVLVVDQVRSDCSVSYGLADQQSFAAMLTAALEENPDKEIIVKLHPDVFTRAAASHFTPETLNQIDRVRVIADNCHPTRLIEHADTVYVVTSLVGFEALIWGKRVRTFGMPFYAGWGLTKDELSAPKRRCQVTLQQLVYAALIAYPRYVHPTTGEPCEVEQAIEHIRLQREKRAEFATHLKAIGFSRWKRPIIADFLRGSTVLFSKKITDKDVYSKETLIVWGAKHITTLQGHPNTLRVEDGFLRSSGLGADLIRPLSMLIDDIGIYFDASRPSRLENYLNTHNFTDKQRERAQKLQALIVARKLSKYNVGKEQWCHPTTQQPVVLVVGQVESDASIEFGSPKIKTNIELLKQVRKSHPDAYLIYKPHPDVLAKLRKKGQQEDQASTFCDAIVGNVDLDMLFTQIDELHTMTSLMGFEALLRNVPVTCYGLPFYAGWGLTTDKIHCKRRQRNLSLNELVYGALIAYPRYMDYKKPIFIEPEAAIEQLTILAQSEIQTRNWWRKLIHIFAITWTWARKEDRP